MSEFSVRSDSVDVEQVMRQIRARIREKRGTDYTEAELQKLASVKLEKFLDPRGLRSDLVQQFRARLANDQAGDEFTEAMLYETHRPLLKTIRRLLNPVLKLFINPAAVSGAIQAQSKRHTDVLFYEVLHNLVVEITRLGIEVHNMKMRVESMSSRLDFDERRARSLEGTVQYRAPRQERPRPSPPAPFQPPPPAAPEATSNAAPAAATAAVAEPRGPEPNQSPGGPRPEGGGRRRRRRRRRRPGQNMAGSAGGPHPGGPQSHASGPAPNESHDTDDGPDDGPDDDGAGDQ